MIIKLEDRFRSLLLTYTDDEDLIDSFWKEIELQYSKKNRHYHNLDHISAMLDLAVSLKNRIVDFEVVLFAIWYHDIVYKAIKKNNELKSAKFAEKRLKRLKIDSKRIENCIKLIISTKNHEILLFENDDNKWFLDFDLAILSSNWKMYSSYAKKIRKEYHDLS